nr:MAG: hypothetical protein [Microvirus sp.]
MRFPETFRNSRCMDALKGVCVLLDIFHKASYLDYSDGVIVCPATYDSIVALGGYGFRFSYQKEFSFVGSVDFILTIHVDAIIHRIFEVVPKSDCHVTFQKKKRKK